jgi:twitching motility protein PilT
MRIDGDLRAIDAPVLEQGSLLPELHALMNEEQKTQFENGYEVDFSFELVDCARFRVHVYRQRLGVAGAFRILPLKVWSMEELQLPSVFKEFAELSAGLVLVTGPTGSGKSTTLAALVDHINTTCPKHIITVEDPLEHLHQSKQALVSQREVGKDSKSFSKALRAALREDPDVVFIGELRDLETIALALTAAETGHLVLASLHADSASKAIHRIVDVFPHQDKETIRCMLSESLQAVVSQRLLKKLGGGRVAAWEIMRCNAAIRHLIREDKIAQMYSTIQTSHQQGMNTLDQHLAHLVQHHIIARPTAHEVATNKALF